MLRAITFNGIPITPSSISLPSGGSFDLYNTADQTTNYERLRANWNTNIAQIWTSIGGTGVVRSIVIGNSGTPGGAGPTRGLFIAANGASAVGVEAFYSTANASTAVLGVSASTQLSATSGLQYGLTASPTINQSGTAGATILNVDPTVSASGSGTYLAQRWGWNGTDIAHITSAGDFQVAQGVSSVTGYFFGASLGSTDTVLLREASGVVAQRAGTSAQTFRLYETYTDASNYSRLNHELISNIWRIQTSAAGTGTPRNIAINASPSSGVIYLQTSGTTRWQIGGGGGGGGDLLAGADNAYDIGASGATRPRNLYMASWIRMATTTVASLPAAGTAAAGARMFVTDANATTFASVVAGGGANTVPVYSDGTNWRIG